jgi:hypothetical protein
MIQPTYLHSRRKAVHIVPHVVVHTLTQRNALQLLAVVPDLAQAILSNGGASDIELSQRGTTMHQSCDFIVTDISTTTKA